MASWQDFGSASRRMVGEVLRDGPQTRGEVALALGRSTASIGKLFDRMYLDGLLSAVPDPPTRGSVYSLTAEAERALEEALDRPMRRPETVSVGRVEANSWLLLVQGSDEVVALNRVLADRDLTANVAWAAETDAQGGMLLAMSPGTPSGHVHELYARLTSAGLRCVRIRPSEVYDAHTMRDNAAGIVATSEPTVA
jgi:DNA-binding MarR family transcriptional regulator